MNNFISGRVIKGENYGKKLGFPTANLDRRQFLRDKLKIAFGVYAGSARLGRKVYKAGIVIGPLDDKGLPKIEAHLIGFSGNLYARKLQLEIIKFLRPFKKYRNEQELKRAISADIKRIKLI